MFRCSGGVQTGFLVFLVLVHAIKFKMQVQNMLGLAFHKLLELLSFASYCKELVSISKLSKQYWKRCWWTSVEILLVLTLTWTEAVTEHTSKVCCSDKWQTL